MEDKTKKTSKKVWKWVSNILTALIILLVVYVVFEIILGLIKGLPPCIFSHYIFIVATDSMEPTINVGDLVFVKRVTFESVNVQDIISFKDINPSDAVYGQYITHRVIGGDITSGFITKGDNPLASADAYRVSADNFLGVIDGKSALLGKIVSSLSSGYSGLFLVLAIIMIVIIIMEVKNILILNEQRKREKEIERIKKEIMDEENK